MGSYPHPRPSTRLLDRLGDIYGKSEAPAQAARYALLTRTAREAFGGEPRLFTAPGRTELGGNHTDHNRGRVLCAAVTLDAAAAAVPADGMSGEIWSDGWPRPFLADFSSPEPVKAERGTTDAILRGVAAGFLEAGLRVGGFKAVVNSNVLPGSGLSSSAALEVLLGTILSGLYNDGAVPPLVLARVGQRAENRYFGKPCGLMDQTASALGGVLLMDFENPYEPLIERVDVDLEGCGYALAVVSVGDSHAGRTEEYAAIPREMGQVAAVFGKETLRGLDRDLLLRKLPEVQAAAGDRAALRALHFLAEDERADAMRKALEQGRMRRFLKLVDRSGSSSWRWLQNVQGSWDPRIQPLGLGLALTESFLGRKGACRVHGGGFGGTLQTWVPIDLFDSYRGYMEGLLGPGCVTRLRTRREGAGEIKAGNRRVAPGSGKR